MGAYERYVNEEQGEQTDSPLPSTSGERGPVWVEELAGPEDYWLTLTDAARVTRRQEVTIRRWVAAGSLPIRNRALGINKRTRHVRASDLARMSPIVDASATISGATARIDLLSIPEQQAHIQKRQSEIDEQAQALTALVEQVGHAAGAQQTQLDEQQARLAAVEVAAAALRSEIATGAELASSRQAALERQLTSLQKSLRRLDKETKGLHDGQEALRSSQERVAARQTEQESERQGLVARIQELEKQQSQAAEEGGKLQSRIDEEARRTDALEQHVQRVEAALTPLRGELRQQAVAAKRQADAFAEQLLALQRQLREAQSHSQAVADLTAREHKQLQQLAKQLAALAVRVPVPAQAGEPAKKPVRRRSDKEPVRRSTG